jgi:nucleoside-diphosphate-sugar epimerase
MRQRRYVMSPDTRYFVTGAGGFIGGWVVESLYLNGMRNIRAGVHRWSTAARIGRFPIEIVHTDITNPQHVAAAMKDVDVVIHCAYGSQSATVKGTELLLNEAARQGVKRFVHLSTIDVYGGATGEVNEDVPLMKTDNDYGNTKIEAENHCWRHIEQKTLPVVILRPTIVYGPFCKLWIAKFAERLQSGKWGTFTGVGEGTCNLVYVHDLLQAIYLSIESDRGLGKAFNINGREMITWNDYFTRFNNALGLPPLQEIAAGNVQMRSRIMAPAKVMARYMMSAYSESITNLYKKSTFARRMMKSTEQRMKVTPGAQELKMYGLKVHYGIEKAESILGYKPAFEVKRGLASSVQWLEHEMMFSHNGPLER